MGAVNSLGKLPAFPEGCTIAEGCPAAAQILRQALGEEKTLTLYQNLGLFAAPAIRLPTASGSLPQGDAPLKVSPLHMALAAASLSGAGLRPPPILVLAVKTPQAGWVVLPPLGEAVQVLPQNAVLSIIDSLEIQKLPYWQSTAVAVNGSEPPVTWYLGGTLPTWQGVPLAVAVLIEEDDPALATVIGQAVLKAVMQP